MSNNDNILNGVILAGGKSSRMGTEKGLVEVNGKAMIEHILEAFNKAGLTTTIITNGDRYSAYKLPTFKDMIPNCGPIGGIYTALKHLHTSLFVCSCDIPFINEELILDIIHQNKEDVDVTLALHKDKIEPLCAIYNISALPILTNQISDHEYKMHDAISLMNKNLVNVETKYYYDNKLFKNINTIDELKNEII